MTIDESTKSTALLDNDYLLQVGYNYAEQGAFQRDCIINEDETISCSTVDLATCTSFLGAPVLAINSNSVKANRPGQEKLYLGPDFKIHNQFFCHGLL